MKHKRFVSILLTLAMVLTLFAGFGALNATAPEGSVPANLIAEDAFVLYVEDVQTVSGTTEIVGTVANGTLTAGETIWILGVDDANKPVTLSTHATLLEISSTSVSSITKGDQAGIRIESNVAKSQIHRGDAVTNYDAAMLPNRTGNYYGEIQMNSDSWCNLDPSDEFGLDVGIVVMAKQRTGYSLSAGEKNREILIGEFERPLALFVGQVIPIRYDGKSYGSFKVMGYNPTAPAKRVVHETVSLERNKTATYYFTDTNYDQYHGVVPADGNEIPTGMTFGWGEVTGPRYYGTPTGSGKYNAAFEIENYSDEIIDYDVRAIVYEKDTPIKGYPISFIHGGVATMTQDEYVNRLVFPLLSEALAGKLTTKVVGTVTEIDFDNDGTFDIGVQNFENYVQIFPLEGQSLAPTTDDYYYHFEFSDETKEAYKAASCVTDIYFYFADVYDITVCGTTINEKNMDDVLGDGGSVNYVPAENTLYIWDDIDYSGTIILNELPELTVCFPYDATLCSDSGCIIECAGNDSLTITSYWGPSKVYFETYGTEDAIYAYNYTGSYVTVENIDLDVYSQEGNAIYGDNGILKVAGKKTELRASSWTEAAINGFDDIELDGVDLIRPDDAHISSGGVYTATGNDVSEVVFAYGYDLKIDGIRVNDDNKASLFGVFQYIPSTQTLRIKGDHTSKFNAINSHINGLLIDVVSTSKLDLTNAGTAIRLEGDTTIHVADGESLSVISPYNYGFLVTEGDLLIEDANIAITSKGGVYGYPGATLTIDNSNFSVLAESDGIANFDDLALIDCEIILPVNAVIDGGTVKVDGEIAAGVIISSDTHPVELFDLWIDGVQVSDTNCGDVLGNGVFEYNYSSKTLIIKGNYDFTKSIGIDNKIDGLKIKVAANSKLTVSNGNPINSTKSLTITGPGKLTLGDSCHVGIYMQSDDPITLTLDTVQLDVTSAEWGIAGDSKQEQLIVKASTVTANAPKGAICDFGAGITLFECQIVVPEEGQIDNGSVCGIGGDVAKEAVIQSDKPFELVNPFVDVIKGKFYYDAVLWAYYATPQITNGMDATHFAPEDTCKRSHIVTFLWRAKGCPEPTMTESPFTDVTNKSAFYYKAVLWAVENGITAGKSPTTFAPDAGCKRSEVVTFLWRAEGKPAPAKTENPFNDVKSGTFYYDAVLWAYHHTPQITNGMDMAKGLFGTDNTCTRGQIATFLKRTIAPEA